jgi:polar amino acid transport system substrate-binding protein
MELESSGGTLMKFDKRLALLFVSLFALVLIAAACGEEEPTETGGSDSSENEESSDLTVVEEGILTVGSDIPYPPFEFEEAGELTGFDVEIVREVADRLGLENPDDAWISTDFGTIFQQLASGTSFDIVAAAVTAYAPEGTPASETVAERTAVVDFTIPFYPSLQSLTVDSEANPDITSVDSLPDGARVGVQRATTGAFYAEQELTGAELVSFEKAPQMYQQLQAGQLDAVFNDLPVTLESIADKPGLEVVEQVETGEEYAIAVSKDNPELTEAINGALEEMFDDGTFAEIYSKYFPEQDLPDYASE